MKIIFMGRKKYAAEMLKWTIQQGIEVVAVCTDSQFSNSITMKTAQSLNIPVITMEEAEELVLNSDNEIDLVVSYLYWRKIRKPLIELPKFGCINFHPAILPDWRGTAGYNVAIMNKLERWGATAHYVNENIDTGDIIKVYDFSFDYRIETAQSLEKKTQQIQMDLYKNIILDVIDKGRLDCLPQEESQGTYISRKQMEDMKKIDIEKDDIDLKIRAFWFPPYDGAYIEINGVKYTLVNDEILRSLIEDDITFIK